MSMYLREHLSYDDAKIVVESNEDGKGGKSLYMVGKFLGGAQVNENGRVYPAHEIRNAVNELNETVKGGYSVLGEVDHPEGLNINLDRVSHMITKMWMEDADGYGKLKIIPTPMGQLVSTMLESGVKLGVSSRGSGNVSESTGHVSDFKIVTVDIVAQPSAPGAYPKAVYESLMNMRGGHSVFEIAKEASADQRVQKYLREGVIRLIKDLKLQEKK